MGPEADWFTEGCGAFNLVEVEPGAIAALFAAGPLGCVASNLLVVEPVVSAALFVAGLGVLAAPDGVVPSALLFGVPVKPFGATTPAPEKTPGFVVAATAGVP